MDLDYRADEHAEAERRARVASSVRAEDARIARRELCCSESVIAVYARVTILPRSGVYREDSAAIPAHVRQHLPDPRLSEPVIRLAGAERFAADSRLELKRKAIQRWRVGFPMPERESGINP